MNIVHNNNIIIPTVYTLESHNLRTGTGYIIRVRVLYPIKRAYAL